MDVNQYVDLIRNNNVNDKVVTKLEELYGFSLTDALKHIVSVEMDDYFISDKYRVISAKEMLSTEYFIGVDLTKLNMIPLVDCMDDDYIVFNFANQKFEMYHIYDEISFVEGSSLEEMLGVLE